MTIAITGASGALGRATAELVLADPTADHVVLTTRRPEALADLAARGAEVRFSDFDQPESLSRAFADVDRLLLISTDAVGNRVEQQRTAVAAAAAAGVRHIAYTSYPRPETGNPALVVPDHARTEDAIKRSGMTWTMLRNNLYAEYQIPVIQAAAQTGVLLSNAGSGTTAYVSRQDCAGAAAAVLVSDRTENETLDITGPHAVSDADLAALAAEHFGKVVRVQPISDADLTRHLQSTGMPDEQAELIASFGAAARGGWTGALSTAVQNLTGTAPKPLSELLPIATS